MLITYESEAINARLQGKNIQYVIPRQTMLIELPIAVMKGSPNKDLANKFIQFVKSEPEQEVFGQYGFRPVNKPAAAKFTKQFPVRPGPVHDQRQDDRRLARGRQEVVRPERRA